MIQRIDNICLVEVAALTDITFPLTEGPDGQYTIGAAWTTLQVAPGSSLIINASNPEAGKRYETNFTATIRSIQPEALDLCLVRITLEGGSRLLIGDKNLPVRMFDDQTLKGKNISFSHTSWHFPFEISDPDSSGSSGGL